MLEVGFARQGRKVSRRRESTVSWKAAPKGFSSRWVGRCSAGRAGRGTWRRESKRKTGGQRRRDTADDKRRGLVRRQGRKVDPRRRSKINWRAAPADAITDESRRLGFRGRAGRLTWETQVKQVGWKAEPEDRRKAQAGRRLEGMAGGSAGGDGRRSGRRRNRKAGWRRKSKAGGKVGSEGWLKAQAGKWTGRLAEGSDSRWRVRGWDWKAEPERGSRRKSEVDWKARLKGWSPVQIGG